MLLPKSKPLLSIVVSAQNLDLHGANVLSWVSKLGEKNAELILVHDLSYEARSWERVKEFSENLRIKSKYIEIRAGNPGEGRNEGLRVAKGEWIAFWDVDDEPNIDEFIEMIHIARNENADVAIGNFKLRNYEQSTVEEFNCNSGDGKFNIYAFAKNPGLWRVGFRRAILGQESFPLSRIGEDRVFLCNVRIFDYKIYSHPKSVYTYIRGNPGSLTSIPHGKQEIFKTISKLRLDSRTLRIDFHFILLSQTLINLSRLWIRDRRILITFPYRNTDPRRFFLICYAISFGLVIKSIMYLQKEESGTIRIELAGGLGNQMFQLANGLGKGKKVELHYVLGQPSLNPNGLPEISSFELDSKVEFIEDGDFDILTKRIFNLLLRLSGKNHKNKFSQFLSDTFIFCLKYSIRILSPGNKLSKSEEIQVGYFQNVDWMHRREALDMLNKLRLVDKPTKIDFEVKSTRTKKRLLVHVRQGDYISEQNFGILPKSYYIQAYKEISKKENFDEIWVSSDNSDHAANVIEGVFDKEFSFLAANNLRSAEILEIMRDFDGYIIANSTFSWWAACLRRNSSAKVMAPDPWFKSLKVNQNLLPNDWTKIETWN